MGAVGIYHIQSAAECKKAVEQGQQQEFISAGLDTSNLVFMGEESVNDAPRGCYMYGDMVYFNVYTDLENDNGYDHAKPICIDITGVDRFTCVESGKDIPKSYQCDNHGDCESNTDEARCDGRDSCGDNSDEANCDGVKRNVKSLLAALK